jgi:hypothetical protein
MNEYPNTPAGREAFIFAVLDLAGPILHRHNVGDSPVVRLKAPAARRIADQDPVGACRLMSVLDQHALDVDKLMDAEIRALTAIA